MSLSKEIIKELEGLSESRFWGYQENSNIARVLASGVLFCSYDGNEILLGLRENTLNSGTWGIFGGKVDNGESPKNSALREAREELGFVPKGSFTGEDFKFTLDLDEKDYIVDAGHYAEKGDKFVYITYLYRVSEKNYKDIDFVLNWEHSEIRWFDPNRMPKNQLHFVRNGAVRHPLQEAVDSLVINKRK